LKIELPHIKNKEMKKLEEILGICVFLAYVISDTSFSGNNAQANFIGNEPIEYNDAITDTSSYYSEEPAMEEAPADVDPGVTENNEEYFVGRIVDEIIESDGSIFLNIEITSGENAGNIPSIFFTKGPDDTNEINVEGNFTFSSNQENVGKMVQGRIIFDQQYSCYRFVEISYY